MTRASLTYFAFLALVFVTLTGCNQTPATPSTAAERVKTLEARVARLEEDYRSAAATRDQARKQAALLAEQKAQLEARIAQLTTDRDATRAALSQEQGMVRQRTSERDVLQTRCEKLKKGLQSLLGQDDAAAESTTTAGSGL